MKDNIRFPYEVTLRSITPQGIETDLNHYKYIISVPDEVFSNSGLNKELNHNNLKLIAEVNCSATMYRNCFQADSLESIKVNIPKKQVRENFSIDGIIIAKESFTLNDIEIKKGMPVAHLGSFSIKIDSQSKGLITFSPTEKKDISYSFIGETINIELPEKDHAELLRFKNRPIVRQFLFSHFGQIALLEACKHLVEGGDKDHLPWYKELMTKWKELDPDGPDFPDSKDHLLLVNYILEKPSEKFTKDIIDLHKTERDE